jgi:hypothetical protein
MCNLYGLTKGQAAIRDWFRAPNDRTGNLPLFPGIFPDQMAPIVRYGPDGERNVAVATWGWMRGMSERRLFPPPLPRFRWPPPPPGRLLFGRFPGRLFPGRLSGRLLTGRLPGRRRGGRMPRCQPRPFQPEFQPPPQPFHPQPPPQPRPEAMPSRTDKSRRLASRLDTSNRRRLGV